MILSSFQYIAWLAGILALAWAASVVSAAFRHGRSKVPGPWLARITPLWRVVVLWDGDAHNSYRKVHKRHGHIVRTAPNVVDVSDPAAIPIIYGISSKFIKSPFYHAFDMTYEGKAMPSMFTTISPEEHKALRRPVAQKFSMTSIRSLEYLVDPCSNIFTAAMIELQGQVVDLSVWVQWYAFDVIGAITFGERFGFMEGRQDINNVLSGLEWGLKFLTMAGQVPSIGRYMRRLQQLLVPLTGPGPMDIITNMVLDAIKRYDKANDSAERVDFLAHLRQQQKLTGNPMSTWDLMNHLMNNLIAGSDTTAISLRAVFYYLLRDKRVYETLQKEIDEFEAAGKLSAVITYGESTEMEYLQLCLKEAMRMHPGVSYPLERVVPLGGTHLSGHFLPEGTVVGVNPAVIHRDRSIFGQDADEFRPERWLCQEDRLKLMDRNLITFGAGTRTCIGKNISIMEMGKLVPQILRQFDLEWASSEPDWKVKTYWLSSQSGLLVRFQERSPTSRPRLD